MALLKCRDCGREVSDQALSCPQCGRHFALATKPKEGIFMQTLNAGCTLVLLAVAAIVLVALFGRS